MNVVTSRPDLPASASETPFLATFVGGMFARAALLRPSHEGRDIEVRTHRKRACAKFEALAELLQLFVGSDAPASVQHRVLACAGHVEGDVVSNDNSPWPIHLAPLREAMALDDVAVLDDVRAWGDAPGNVRRRNVRAFLTRNPVWVAEDERSGVPGAVH
ncbi:MAG: glucokinase [Pseudomonadota bacterium]|nr:glucokinase [Pseudomonadota bacterium]